MNVEHTKTQALPNAKKGFLGVFLFYFLVAFEFAYMAGPFAIYFYSVYSPVLNFFNKIPALAWLIKFFLPHVVRETASPLIDILEVMGIVCALTGFLIFVIGAVQIYYSKLAKKGAVLGGLYTYIRHPQYTAFIVCSFGLMLLWPRYIVIILFVTLVFAYRALARAEEKECEEKFGESYIAYEKRTGRFFPKLKCLPTKSHKEKSMASRLIHASLAHLVTLGFMLSGAALLNAHTLNSLYASYTATGATVSVCQLNNKEIEQIISIAQSDERVQQRLASSGNAGPNLNYILPTEWYAAELPMNGIVYRSGHSSTQDYDRTQYKIIFTDSILRTNDLMDGKSILKKTMSMKPLAEVWVNTETACVTKILEIPDTIKYDGIPVAIY